ncbi:DUF3696 domain-containing protein [Candidatus Poribacteria bacterium]|nr:DUF3696 domain-containing protein [Candidatus Poribacteria bacterium]
MITGLGVRNFKSWEDSGKLQLAPLTGLFGANSSGKTSILQALLLLKQTVEHPSQDWNEPFYFGNEESLVNLGSFDDIVHRPKNNLGSGISVSWQLREKTTLRNINADTLSFFFTAFMGMLDGFHYRFGEHAFDVTPTGNHEYAIDTPFGADTTESLFRCYGIRGISTATQKVFYDLEKALADLFSRILYLGPLREYPRSHYPWEGDHPTSVGLYGEKTVSALLSGRIRQHLSVDEQILKWLRRLELIDSYEVQPISDTGGDYEFLVKKFEGGPEVRLIDVGFGVSQVLPVLILCYYAPEDSVLILEQPEAHLHPKAQSELADVLVDVVKTRNIQIILESHSEHLLLRLMRRIAEYGICDEGISADQTRFYFCEINDGKSKAEQLKVDEYGNISNWPRDFFGDEMGDLAAKTRAEMQRRKANKR